MLRLGSADTFLRRLVVARSVTGGTLAPGRVQTSLDGEPGEMGLYIRKTSGRALARGREEVIELRSGKIREFHRLADRGTRNPRLKTAVQDQ